MFEHVTSLGQGNAGKPLKKLMNGCVLFQIFKKRGNRYPCATENPSAAYTIWVALNIRAERPIKHE